MLLSLEQSKNAPSRISVTLAGITISSSEAQSWKVVVLILVSVEGSSMLCNFVHSLNISGIVAVRFICSKALNSGNEIIFFLANLLR